MYDETGKFDDYVLGMRQTLKILAGGKMLLVGPMFQKWYALLSCTLIYE